MKFLALIQARCGSTSLPSKVLKDLAGKTLLQRVVERVRKSRLVDEVLVITSIDKGNLPLIQLCAQEGIRVFAGAEDDVLDRYYQCARLFSPEYVIRITADCPLIDWRYIDMAAEQLREDSDYIGQLTESFPDGLDVEIIKFSALKEAWEKAPMHSDREHVTQYIRNRPEQFALQNLTCPIPGIAGYRWTVDEEADYTLIRAIYEHFQREGRDEFVTEDVLAYLEANPQLKALNSMYERNEGLKSALAHDCEMQHTV